MVIQLRSKLSVDLVQGHTITQLIKRSSGRTLCICNMCRSSIASCILLRAFANLFVLETWRLGPLDKGSGRNRERQGWFAK